MSAWLDSLSGVADSTRAVYARDAAAAVEWLETAGSSGPAAVDRRALRCYLADLGANAAEISELDAAEAVVIGKRPAR